MFAPKPFFFFFLHCFAKLPLSAVFSFLYLKKIKFQKYMSVFKYFKNIPRSPSHRATGPMCNFFFKFATKSLEKKKEGGLSPPQRATGPCRPPQGRHAPVARWGGDRVPCVNCFRSFLFSKIHYNDAFFSYVVLYLSDYYATFDI